MTTYQEPPLQSRRAARAEERADAPPASPSDPNAEAATPPPASSTAEPLNYATTSRPPLPQYDGQNLRPRRSAETPGHADLPPTEALPAQDAPSYRPKDFSPEGRRAAAPAWAPQYDGTVEFQTQNRDQAIAAAAVAPSAPAAGVAEGTMTRRELRALREANGITALPTDQTPAVDAPTTASEAAPVDTSPVSAPPVADSARAVVEQQPAAAPAAWPQAAVELAPEPVALVTPPPLVAPTPQPSSRLDSALAEFDALAAGREPATPAPDAPAPLPGRRAVQQAAVDAPPAVPVVAPEVVAQEVVAQEVAARELAAPYPVVPEMVVPASVDAEPVESAPQPADGLSAFDALFAVPAAQDEPEPDSQPAAPAPSAAAQLLAPPVLESAPAPSASALDPLLSAPAPQGAPASVPPPPSFSAAVPYPTPVDLPAPPPTGTPAVVAPASGPSSVGHWSTQSDLDDAEQINETTISRSVGAGHGAITTSALVLPAVPEGTIGGPVGGGGEILLTGSISLPQSLSATGAHPSQLDESDLDHLLDPGDHQVANTDSTPVRAIRAVSTHTATGGIIAPHKPSGTRGFTILIIAAAAMAAVVVGLLVVGFVSGTI